MTPTLLDVVMITGLDINSPNPAAHKLAEVSFKLSSKVNLSWQIVTGDDKDDEAIVARADAVRTEAIHAIEEFLNQ